MSSPVTPDAIAHAYRLLLDREPDPGGLEHYRRMAAEGRLTLARLREILLASEEYRTRARARRRRVDLGGVVVILDPEDPAFGGSIAASGDWEPHIAATIARHLSPGATFVDIGANIGTMAFRAARLVGPAGKVIAFEPDPANAALFLQGVVANGFTQVTLLPVALSDAPAVFSLQGGSNAYMVAAETTEVMAQAMRGDDLLGAEPRIDLVKLDIEGHEPRALRGLGATLARHRPWVLAEFNPRCLRGHGGTDPADFAAQVFGLAPRVTAIRHDGREVACDSPAALLQLWQACDREAAASGHLPPGMAHLDLLFRVGAAPRMP